MPVLRVAEVMKKKRVTAYRLAKQIGIDYRNVWRLLKPEANLSFRMLCRIAAALECRVRDLIQEDPKSPPSGKTHRA